MIMATAKAAKNELSLPGYFTCEQAAERLGMKADTIRRYVHRGLISAGIVGNVYLIAERDLRFFQQNRRNPGRPPRAEKTVKNFRR